MAAITWQNISGADMAGAGRTLDAAQQRMDGVFAGLDGLLKKREATDTANWDNTKNNNTQAFLNEVAKFRTPEEFQAAQQSGVLDQMRQGYGAQVDANAVRAAQDGRLAILQGRAKTDADYQDLAQAPLRDQFMAAVQRQDKLTQNIMMNDPTLRNKATLLKAADDFAQQGVIRDRATIKFGFDQAAEAQNVKTRLLEIEKINSDLETAKVQRALQEAQTRNYDAEAKTRTNPKVDPATKEATIKALLADTPLAGGTMDTKEGLDNFYAALKARGIEPGGKEERDILTQFSKKFGDGMVIGTDEKTGKPIKVPVPATVAIEALRRTDSSWYTWDNMGDSFTNILSKRLDSESGDPELIKGIQAGNYIKGLRFNALKPKGSATNPTDPIASETALDAALAASKKKVWNQQ